ncbi:hypothetical protein ACFCX0_48145, partial [Streptomyces sp. NPDC056352]|uniref:hypothetical protein n=1 Tax=Streptomyces sp. NPDC056352 TaxID=3345791 RepID=UPI0035D5E2FB
MLTRLHAALATRQGTKAAMEPMASGVFRIVVPYRGAVSTALAVVTAKVDLSNPVHTGDADTLHVLEGKNVRREDVSYSTSYSWSHSGNAGWNYGHTLHDPTQPVVDGGGGVGIGAAYGQGRSLGSSLGQTRSSGMLHVDTPALVDYDVRVTLSLDHYWGATASTGVVGPVVSLVGKHTRHALVDTTLRRALTLAHSQQLMQPEPPAGPGRPAPQVIPAHRAGQRTGLRPVPEDLTESFIGTIGGLRELLAQAENLLEQNVSPALGSNSWHGARAHVESRLAAVFSMAFMHQRAVHLLSGGTLRVPLTVPGMFVNQQLTLVLSLDHEGLSVTSTHGTDDGTLTGTIVKDFRRSHRSVGGAVDAALRLTGSASLRSGMASEGPDVLRPGVGVDVGRGRGTGQSGGGLSSMLESGDKSMGTLGEELTDPNQRRFAHLSVGRARWNIGLERSGGTGSGVQVTVEKDALTFFAPVERAQQLVTLKPVAITEPRVGAQPPSRGLMPGAWQTGPGNDTETDTDQNPGTTTQHPEPAGEPTQLDEPTPETLTDLRTDIQEQPGSQTDRAGRGDLSGQFSERSLGKRRATREAGIEGSGVDEQPGAVDEDGEEFRADELSPLAAGALARLRRELPDSWRKRLVKASGLLELPGARTEEELAAHHEATVLTAAAVYDTPRETGDLLDYHRAGQPDQGEPPARGTVLLTALDEVLRDLPVGQNLGGGGSRPDTDPAYEGIFTPGASGSGLRSQEEPVPENASLPASLSDPLAVVGPVPVSEMSTTDWIRDRDARDEGLLFAPPEAFTASSLRQYGGAGTFDLPDGRLHGAIREAIVRAVPEGVREGVRRALDERFSVESFISELPQAIGDRLVLGLHVDGRYFEAAVRVRVGDWRQVTDPHGRRLPGTEQFLPPSVSWKREPRTRQLLESGESVGSSRTRAHGIGLPAAIVLNYTIEAVPHLSSAAALFSSVLAGYSASSTSTVSSGATTARYTKGTYRAVDFLYDVLYDVTVQAAGGSVAPGQHQAVLEGALVGRHDRRLLQSRPRPSEEVTHATSEWWHASVPAIGGTGSSAVSDVSVPAMPFRGDAGTALLHIARETLGQHRGHAARGTTAFQDWWPLGRPEVEEAGGDTDPAGTEVGPDQLHAPLRVPRTSVVESFDHTEALRRAVFSVLPESMSRVGTPEKSAVDAFTAVHSIAGALHRAMAGGYLSVPFSTGGGATESVELSTVFHDVELVTEEDGRPRVDWMIHIDTEDVNVDNVAHRHSGSDGVSLSASALLGTGAGQFGSTVSVPALGGSRSVGVSDPGQQAGSVTLHKVKLEEPTVVLAGRTRTTVRGRGGRAETVEGTARLRILLQDAVRLGLVNPRQAPRAVVDGPHAGNVELHARTSPDRRLRFAPVLGSWLPQLSRVDSVDHGDAGRLMDRVLRAVRAVAPDMLPQVLDGVNPPAAPVRGVKAHEHTNFMTITNLVRPEPLAARLHDILNGGISVVLSRPGLTGPQEVVLTLSGTLDPDDFTHRGMWDGNSETYYGGFYELQGDRSTAFSLEGGFDVPLNYSSTPDLFRFRGAGGRIAPRVGTGWVSTTGGGFSVGGASGGGSRFMAGFEGAVDVRVTVSRSRPPAPVQAQPPAPVTDGGNVIELTTIRSTTGAPARGTDLGVVEEGRVGEDTTAPVSLNLRLMVADDLLEERGPEGQWHDSVGMRSHLDPDTRMASRELDPNWQEVVYAPGENERPPLHTLFMADTSRMHTAVEGLLTDLDVDLEPSERVGLHTALNAMGSRVEDFIGASRPFWTRTVGRDTFGMPIRLELQLQAVVKEMTTRGVSQTSYQYDHTLTTASVSDSATRDLISVSGSLGANASFTSGPRPQGYGGTAEERNAATHNSHTPTAGYRYGEGAPRTVTVSAEGQSDRVDIVLGAQEHIYARMEYRLVATLSSRSPVPLGGDPATARTYGQRTANRTIEDAHALLVMPAGLAERMREQGQGRASAETAEPAPQAGPSRLSPAPSPVPSVTGVGPFPTTHPADGLGHAVLHDIPDFTPVVEGTRRTLFRQLDADHAELVLTRLRAALATRQGTKAAMEPMASGVFRIVVPYRGAVSTALAVVTAQVDLSNPVHRGATDTLHVIEGKNVRREDVSSSVSSSWSHSGNAGWNYGHTLHDPTQPVVDGGGGAGFGAAYGQGRSLGSSLGQTRSSGMLHVDTPALVAYDVRVTISLDHYWGATASTGVIGPVVSLVGRHTRHQLAAEDLPGALTLAHSQQLMQPASPAGPGRPAPRTIPAHRAGPRAGLRPVPEDLTESFIGTIGGLRALLAQAENLLEENVSSALGSNSWHGARAHLESRLAVVFSMAFMHQRAVHLLGGGMLRVPLTVPGMFTNQGLTLVLSLDHELLSVTSRHGEGAGTITGTIVKDFRRSHRSVGGAVDAALRVTGSASLRSGLATEGPDVLRPGVGVDVGRGRGTGQSGGGLSSMLESGDKSMGTLGEELTDADQRRYAHLSVGRARWNIGLERSGGTGAGIQVTVEQDALTFFAPEERAQRLLALQPTVITEPLVGAQPPSRGLRGLMPGAWQSGPDSDSDSDIDSNTGQAQRTVAAPTEPNLPTAEERNNRDRGLAAAPDPAWMPDEAFEAYWDHLPTDTAGFVRAAVAARSLLAEQGRVTDPLTSMPFSALTADGRAARRLAVVFHGDSGLYRNPARRDEALARALELLDDPAPVRPVTESSAEPEAVPDVVSTTGPDPDTLVDEAEFEGAEELSPLAAEALARLRRELPDSWQERLIKASGLLDLPRAKTEEERIARLEAMVLTAAAVYDTPRETGDLLDHHRARQPGRGEPPARGTVLLTALHEVLHDLPVGHKHGGGGSRPVTDPAYEGMSTPGASGSGSDPLAVAVPVPVPEMSPEDWIRDRDARDEGLLFAPPAAFTSASLRQYGGAGTFDLPDGRLHAAIREAIVQAVPEAAREGVRRALDDRFSVESFISELPQAIGDRLVLGLHVDGRYFEAAVRVRVGDWRQVTDPHGRRLPGTEQFLPPSVSWKREPRTRQLLESGESVGSSRTRAHGIGLPAAIVLNYTIDAIPHLSSVAALFSSVLAGYSASSTSTVSSGATTARYTKGTYRAVDFLYDVLFDVTVQGGSVAPRQHQDVLEEALVGRHDRRLLQSRPRPPQGVTHATSGWWHAPVPPSSGDAGTALLHNAVEALRQHRAHAARDTTAYQEWWPLGRPEEEADGTDPAVTEGAPNQRDIPLRVPRTSVVESFDHTEELRRAVFSVLPESMSRVGTPEKTAVDAFTAVHSIAGALHRAMAGGYLSVPFNTGGGPTEFIELSTVFHDMELVTEEDGTPRVDWMIHIDTEDVNVDNVAHRHSGSDALSISAAALWGAGTGQFGSTVSVPALGGSRSVGVSDPGQQAGSVTLHKVKLEEPTVVLAGRTLTTVRGRGREVPVEGTARLRILLQDAIRLGLIDPRQAPRATVDGPHAGNVELHARTSPDRRLRFASVLDGWLPQLSRVDSVDHDDARRLMDQVMRAVRAAAPDMLPSDDPARGVKAHEHTNLMTITNLVRPEPLAARLHDIVNGGISVVLSRPGVTGPQEVVLTLSGTLDPDDFTHRGMWDGNSET